MWKFQKTWMTLPKVFATAFLLRITLFLYGIWQDENLAIKFTDVDYRVFSDAARFVSSGKSPYLRPTYRYTPLIAWILVPGVLTNCPNLGKLVFLTVDLICGLLQYRLILKGDGRRHSSALQFTAVFWLFNPLTAMVSTRGNAESLISMVVLLCLERLLNHRYILAGSLFGLSVHMKVYPAIYVPGIYLWLCYDHQPNSRNQRHLSFYMPNKNHFIFGIPAALTFSVFTAGFYTLYGFEFLEHSYLYHVTREDIKHNFSIYFYPLYLFVGSRWTSLISLSAFVPQMVLILLFSWRFNRDLPFSCFLSTFIFVMFNKVCTSQYFLWYITLLPMVAPNLNMKRGKSIFLIFLWFLGQGFWLLPAYLLEFQAWNTFFAIWLASIVFFLINVYILKEISVGHKFSLHVTKKPY